MPTPTRLIRQFSPSRSLLSTTFKSPDLPPRICLSCQTRLASAATNSKYKASKATPKTGKKKEKNMYKLENLAEADKFSLVDAMRYIRAFEVGLDPTGPKYEIAVRLRTLKSAPVVRSIIQLPHPVQKNLRICVICPPDSEHAAAARAAGASVVGEDAVFEDVKAGKIEFDRCLCHEDSLLKMTKAGLGRVLGPKGLMPSAKMGTVVQDVAKGVSSMISASEYREREGTVRMAIASLSASPYEVRDNLRAVVASVKRQLVDIEDVFQKQLHEVVISSTHGPGFTLSGDFEASGGKKAEELEEHR